MSIKHPCQNYIDKFFKKIEKKQITEEEQRISELDDYDLDKAMDEQHRRREEFDEIY